MSHAGRLLPPVAAASVFLALLIMPAVSEAGLAIVIGGSGTVHPGERLTYRIDFRHAYDPRSMNGIAPGDHVSITLSPPACGQLCVVRRLSRDLRAAKRHDALPPSLPPRVHRLLSRAIRRRDSM